MMKRFFCSASAMLRNRGLRMLGMAAAALFLSSCSRSEEAPAQEFALILSESFTFSETQPAANTISLAANGLWELFHEPADLEVRYFPASGGSSATIRITEMPAGCSVRIGVRLLSGAVSEKTITVTRAAAEDPEPEPEPEPDPDPVPDPSGAYRFPELPGNWIAPSGDAAARSGDRAFYTHRSQSVKSGKAVRNYSYCYDTRRRNPVWVAYPLHALYREGGTGRTNPDPWRPDPALDEALQSKIYKSAGDGDGIYDGYQFWNTATMTSLGVGGYWSKGHLCMSSERGGADSELNMQTFYPTNIAPQSSAAASDFATVWSYVESLFSGTNDYKNTDFTADDGRQNINIVADTLFLVAGCYYEHDDWKEYDASNYSYDPRTSAASKLCIMPTHQFKMALRTKKGNTGKRIAECSADELQAVGFWIEAFPTLVSSSAAAQLRAIAVPVSFIEQKTGIEFFPGVPASVKAGFDAAEWGF
ncbi:MAG: DNA/RNA non-specific endonuclease [Alistipes sp.]|nr:DNA/RNA non-specific endonuclease [Alistipes senegalensis]MCM1250569.1 DNA/RNA non-specific endonuclease [Alistipes sp.]